MKSKQRIIGIAAVVALLAITAGYALAHASTPGGIEPSDSPAGVNTDVQRRFTYQGVLKENGQPVTGSRAMLFYFHTNSTCTALIYDVSNSSVPVTAGLFTFELFVQPNLFNGQAVWLEVIVGGESLGCQRITPVPYALSLVPGSYMIGSVTGDSMLTVDNQSVTGSGSGIWVQTDAPEGRGLVGGANSNTGINYGVYGASGSPDGFGVYGVNPDGVAVGAHGAIQSTADSVLYLSPHDMVVRMDENSGVILTPLQGGGVRVRNNSGGVNVEKYLSIPLSTFGTLLGSQVYVKSLDVCYRSANIVTFISATTVSKNNGGTGEEYYIRSLDNKASTTHDCYTLDAATPLKPIDNSSWVQFNMHFNGEGSGADIYIYTVKVTLSQFASD